MRIIFVRFLEELWTRKKKIVVPLLHEFLPLSSFGVIDGVEDPEPRGPKVAGPDVLGVIIIFLRRPFIYYVSSFFLSTTTFSRIFYAFFFFFMY